MYISGGTYGIDVNSITSNGTGIRVIDSITSDSSINTGISVGSITNSAVAIEVKSSITSTDKGI